MNNKIILLTIILLISPLLSAKDEKINIGILQFQKTQQHSGAQKDYTSFIEDMITSTFVSEGRFNIVERSDLDAITAERIIQEIKNVKNASKIRDMGVSWIVVGEVSKIHVTHKRTREGSSFYSAAVGFTLKIINVETGTIAYSKSFANGGSKFGLFKGLTNAFADTSTPDGAIAVVLKDLNKEVHDFVGKSFPIVIEIISIEKTDKKGIAKEILVAGGEQDGMKKKVKLVLLASLRLI